MWILLCSLFFGVTKHLIDIPLLPQHQPIWISSPLISYIIALYLCRREYLLRLGSYSITNRPRMCLHFLTFQGFWHRNSSGYCHQRYAHVRHLSVRNSPPRTHAPWTVPLCWGLIGGFRSNASRTNWWKWNSSSQHLVLLLFRKSIQIFWH